MKAHIVSQKWWNDQYGIPKHETIVNRIATKEGGLVDYIITRIHKGDYEDDIFRLYKVTGIRMPSNHTPISVKYTGKQSKDPRTLAGIAFNTKEEKK